MKKPDHELLKIQDPEAGVLQRMIDRQVAFQDRLNADPELPGTKGTTLFDRLEFFADAIIMEGAEMKDWLKWKRHKRDYGQDPDRQAQYEMAIEAIDVLHYGLNVLIELGYGDEDEILRLYLRKNDINHTRQDARY